MVGRAGGEHARQPGIGVDREHEREAARPEALGEDRDAAGDGDAERPRLVHVGEQHRDRLLGRPPLGREQPLDRVGEREVRGDPVDRVGGDRDDPARRGAARRPPRAPRRRRGAPGSSQRGRGGGRGIGLVRRAGRRGRPEPRPPAARRCGPPRPRARAPAPRSARRPRPPRRARRRSGPRRGPPPAPWPSPPRGPASPIISMSLSASPTVITWPIGTPARRASQATARPLDTPGATNSRNRGWETVAPARPVERPPRLVDQLHRPRRVADRDHLGHRLADRGGEVGHDVGLGPEVARVVLEARVAAPDDDPLEVVDVRVEAALEAPRDRLARDRGGHRRVAQDAADRGAERAGRRGR